MLFKASGRGALLTIPRLCVLAPKKAEIQGFLLRYRLFLYYYWFSQNIKNGWIKYFSFLVMKMNYCLPLCS